MTYYVIFCIYLIVLLVAVWYGKKQVESYQDYIVGGWRVSIPIAIGTFAASFVSCITATGVPSMIYRDGLSMVFLFPFTWSLSLLLMFLFAYRIRRSPEPPATMAEYLRLRFEPDAKSSGLQALAAISVTIGLLIYVVIQMKAMGIIIEQSTGLSYSVGVGIMFLLALYTAMGGGMWSVAVTDLFNMIVLMLGLIIVGVTTVSLAGGWSNIIDKLAMVNTPAIEGAAATDPKQFLSLIGTMGPIAILGVFLSNITGNASPPHFVGRILTPKNSKAAMYMLLGGSAVAIGMYFFATLTGLAGRVIIPTLPANSSGVDILVPFLIIKYIHPIIGGIVMAGIMAAAVSTANSCLHLSAVSLTHDLIRNFYAGKMSDDKAWKVTRVFQVILAVIALILAWNPPGLIAVLTTWAMAIWSSTFFIPLLLGLYWRRFNRPGAYACIFGGIFFFIVAITLNNMHVINLGKFSPGFVGVLTGLILGFIVTMSTKPARPELTALFVDREPSKEAIELARLSKKGVSKEAEAAGVSSGA